jgi:hypothetical protein
MMWVESFPLVSTMAARPCLVTERKVWEEAAARMASTWTCERVGSESKRD